MEAAEKNVMVLGVLEQDGKELMEDVLGAEEGTSLL